MKYKIIGKYEYENWIMLKLEDGRFGVIDIEKMKKWIGCNSTFDLLRGGNRLIKEVSREMYEKVLKVMEDDTQDFEFWEFILGRELDDLSLDDMEITIIDN